MTKTSPKRLKPPEPRFAIRVDPDLIVKHWSAFADFCLHAPTEDPLDVVFEMRPGTSRLTGKMMFLHAGHSKLAAEFFTTKTMPEPMA